MILAVDTSSTSGSIALMSAAGRLVAERTVGDVGTHAGWLMKNTASLLAAAGVTPGRIGLFAMTLGPGSFTGLRIGVSTVKGLAWAAGKTVAGVSTLEALAFNMRYSGLPVCTVLDARKGEVYAAVYRFSGGAPKTVVEDSALAPEALFRVLDERGLLSGPVLFTGSGLALYSEAVKKNLKNAIIAPEPLWHVRAANVALMALERGLRGEDPAGLRPRYLRKSEAELKRKKGLSA